MDQSHLAIVFPGQGSQQVGMLKELAISHPIVKQTFNEASQALGYDLFKLVMEGPEEQLNQTEFTQPALLTAGVAVYRVLQAQTSVKPAIMAGHSLGEYTALVCANSLAFAEAVTLVAERGQLMQAAVPAGIGAMAAIIGLETEIVQAICETAAQNEVVAPANINAIGQIVISGHIAAVERAVVLAKEQGAKIAKLIPVSVPSHCELMRPAAEKLKHYLQTVTISAPASCLIHNVDVQSHTAGDAISDVLAAQLYSPVRWVETIQYFAKQGITHILELGPGKILAGLNKRIDNQIVTLPVYDAASLQTALDLLQN